MKTINTRFWIGLSIILIAHLLLDFMLGVWPVYKTLAQVDLVIAGIIASFGTFVGEGLQPVFGYLSDRGYHQKLLATGIGLTATIPFLSYVESEAFLFMMILFCSIGGGIFHPPGTSLSIPKKSSYNSLFIALFACFGSIGAASSQILYTFFFENFGGQLWFLVFPILFCVLGCALFSFPKVEQSVKKIDFKDVLKSLKPQKSKLILLYIIQVLIQMVAYSFGFLLPDILLAKGYEKWFCLGGGYFCYILGCILAAIPIGYLVGKMGYRLVLGMIVSASAGLLYLFLGLETLSLIQPMFILFLIGTTMGVFVPVSVASALQDVPVHTRSFVSAIYMGGANCLAGFGPVLVSLFASFFDNHAVVIALQGVSFLLILSLGLIYCLPNSLSIREEEYELIRIGGE